MCIRSIRVVIVVLLVVSLVLSLSSAAFANPALMNYYKRYIMDGSMEVKIQAGDSTTSTSQSKTLIQGTGAMDREEIIKIGRGYLDVQNHSTWKADPNSLAGLKIVSAVKLNESLGNSEEHEAGQVFAVSVKANPGEDGRLSQATSATSIVYADADTFYIDQRIATSGGEVKRYIDLTEPVTGQWLFEDSRIRGAVDITESLRRIGSEPSEIILDLGETFIMAEEMPATAGFEQEENTDDGFILLEGGELFETVVPLNTPFNEIDMPDTLVLNSDMMLINDVAIQWDENTEEKYNPEQAGSYVFEGVLIFPENITAPGNFLILYTVHVVDQ